MRTTLTLEPDVAQQVKRVIAEKKLSLKRVVNDALRAGFAALRQEKNPRKFRVEPFSLEFKPGIDQSKLGQVLDQLEIEECARKHRGTEHART